MYDDGLEGSPTLPRCYLHSVKIKESRTANTQGESADLAGHFSLSCRVTIVFGTNRDELGDGVTIQFIRHVPEKVANGNERLTRAPFIDHTVGVIVKALLLEGV